MINWTYTPVVYRSTKYTQRAHELSCIKCGKPGASLCHYTGPRQHQYGKGRGLKGSDMMGADFCDKCHHEFDEYRVPEIEEAARYQDLTDSSKMYMYSEEFLHYCMLTIHRRLEYGDKLQFRKKYLTDEHFANL